MEGTNFKLIAVSAGTQITVARVEKNGDNVDVFFLDSNKVEHRVRFEKAAAGPGASKAAEPRALLSAAFVGEGLDAQSGATSTTGPTTGNWKNRLRSVLEEYYQPVTEGLLSDRKGYGKTLLLRAGGVSGDPDDGEFIPYMTAVKGGKVLGEGGQHDQRSRVFLAGEQLFVTQIDVGTRDDADFVDIRVTHATPIDVMAKGSKTHMRFKASLRFLFPRDGLKAATAQDVAREIAPVLQTEEDSKAAKTIALGQTPEEVKRALGEPDKIVDLGEKKIFVYKDMKVVFVKGKVSDVQ